MARPKSDNVQNNISIPSEWKTQFENAYNDGYEAGLRETFRLLMDLIKLSAELDIPLRDLVFNNIDNNSLKSLSSQEQEKYAEQFTIGDEVTLDISHNRFIITGFSRSKSGDIFCEGFCPVTGGVTSTARICNVTKTGRHFDEIERFIGWHNDPDN